MAKKQTVAEGAVKRMEIWTLPAAKSAARLMRKTAELSEEAEENEKND